MTEKVKGALSVCTACGEEIECHEFTYQGKKSLSWCDVDTETKHYGYDYQTGETWCKKKGRQQAEQSSLDQAIHKQNKMMDEASLSQGRQTDMKEYDFELKKAYISKAWEYAKEFAKKEIPDPVLINLDTSGLAAQANQVKMDNCTKERRILASVIFYGLVGGAKN